MSYIVVKEAADLNAAPAEVYALISDYKVGHPSILPKPFFGELIVEEGGQGAGTVIRFTMHIMGKEYRYHQTVSEPEPGRLLQETDLDQDLNSTFLFEPLNQGQQTRLTITTTLKASGGLKGLVEKAVFPMTLRPIYKKELQLIAERLAERAQARPSNQSAGQPAAGKA